MNIDASDALKIHDVLVRAHAFHQHRDQMNANAHLAPQVRYSPLTSQLEAEGDRLRVLLEDEGLLG